MNFNLKLKQISILAILFIVMSLCALYAIYYFSTKNFIQQTQQQLNKLDSSFDILLEENKPFNLSKIQQLTASDDFLKVLISNNLVEISKLIDHLKEEISAQRIIFVSPSYEIIFDTNKSEKMQGTFPYPNLLKISSEATPRKSTIALKDVLYRSFVTPVALQKNTYWLVTCQQIEPILRQELSILSLAPFQMEIAYRLPNQRWQSTNPNSQALKYLEKSKEAITLISSSTTMKKILFTVPFVTTEKSIQTLALVTYAMSDVLLFNQPLFFQLGTIIFGSMLLLFTLVFLSLRGTIKTIKNISHTIQNTDNVDPDFAIPVIGSKESIELAKLFNNMLQTSSTREKELMYQGRHDPVTKLPNRYYFLEYLSQRLSKCDPTKTQMGIVTIAVDRFTQINHTLGHPVGQRLLHHVGARLANTIKNAEMLGQLTNHVFIALIPNLNPTNFVLEAQHILNSFESAFSVYTVNIDLDGLVGFSFYPQDGVDADILMQKSDVALYSAKYASERFAVYNTDKDPHHFTKLSLMSELREGITQNEFEVYYQPKIDLKTGKIVQVESLIRWIHPVKGFMSPGLFIPLAEETGHIKKLTLWLIEDTLKQCAKWHQNNLPLGVSINLSVKDLLNKELYNYITTCMKLNDVNPTWITLEITESAFMHDPDKAMEAIQKLRDFGFHFSIDDFGTGFSSLSYLKQIPVNELKIDQSFTRDIAKHTRVADLVHSTVELGHSLKMSVVAEGIEDLETHDLLQSFGCDIGQGYLFSKPLPVSELEKWINTSDWGINGKGK